MMKSSIFLATLITLFNIGLARAAEPPASQPQVVLQNDALRVVIDPASGARGREFVWRKHDYNFVRQWKWTESKREGNHYQGGVFAGMMDGSYRSVQLVSPYKILDHSARSVTLQYDMHGPLLEGLRETRTIRLSDSAAEASVQIIVANTSDQPRTIRYRFQDWIGTGRRRGRDSVYLLPQGKDAAKAFMLNEANRSMTRFELSPQQAWYAMEDLPADAGLLVRVEGSPAKGIFIWSSQAEGSRAGELFLPRQALQPGEQWRVTVHYRAFAPSDPATGDKAMDARLARSAVDAALQAQSTSPMRPLPYDAQLTLPIGHPAATLLPVGATDPRQLFQPPDIDAGRMTLRRISLAATPGEMTPFAFRVRAMKTIRDGTVHLSALKGDGGTIDPGAFDPRYVTSKGNYLVHDWTLARQTPDALARINNDLHGADHLTPFSLSAGEDGLVWVYCRVPKDAKAGVYHGRCTIKAGDESTRFDIELNVRPFTLQRPTNKHYGSFFRYYLPGDAKPDAKEPQPGLISRKAYRAALQKLDDVGYDSLMIYAHNHDDILWVLDQCVDLGWTHGTFILVSTAVTPEELKKRYGQYDMTFLAWGVDEPSRERQIPKVIAKYESLLKRGYTPVFTPNVPLGLLMADSLKKIVPVMALSGNAPYAFDATERYHQQGRKVYWYNTGMGRPSLDARLTRGIYLWKEPVDGVIDWGEDAAAPHMSDHQLAGFIGDRTIPTLGRENVRQGLYDLAYLHTLQAHLKSSTHAQAVSKGKALLQWVRDQFGADWHEAARQIDGPEYLAALREKISDCIVQLDQSANPKESK